jgi:hypothetical protein
VGCNCTSFKEFIAVSFRRYYMLEEIRQRHNQDTIDMNAVSKGLVHQDRGTLLSLIDKYKEENTELRRKQLEELDKMKEHYNHSVKVQGDLLGKYKEALGTLKSKVNEDNGNCTTIIIRNDEWEKISALN